MQTEQIDKLAAALAKAQGEIGSAAKDATNPHFKSKYADMASVVAAMREPFAKAGLAIHQGPRNFGDELRLVTRILHASGQWLEDDGYPLLLDKQNMQGLGSASTYARRYGLMAAAGVAPEDDDGNAATGNGKDAQPMRGGARREKGDFSGMGVTELKKQAREFVDGLNACETMRDLEEHVAGNASTLGALKADLPNWWHSSPGSDVAGIEERIEERKQKLLATANLEPPANGAPMLPEATFTEDGFLAVPQENNVVNWSLWAKQFQAHLLNKAETEAEVKALGTKYRSPLDNLKKADPALYDALKGAVEARKAAVAQSPLAAG